MLDELTQTPLILSEVVVIFESGGIIPQAKMGVLDSVMRILEQSEEHSSHLQVEPLSGRAWEYLAALAAAMMAQGAVTLAEEDARATWVRSRLCRSHGRFSMCFARIIL